MSINCTPENRHSKVQQGKFTYIAPQAAYAASCVTDTDRAGQSAEDARTRSQTLACSHRAARSPSLPFKWFTPRHPCRYNGFSFSDPGGMEGRVGLVGLRSSVNRRSGRQIWSYAEWLYGPRFPVATPPKNNAVRMGNTLWWWHDPRVEKKINGLKD